MAKKIYAGVPNFTVRNLPSGYTQIEYIQSDGTQSINMEIVPKSPAMVVEMDVQYSGSNLSAFVSYFGLMKSSSETIPRLGVHHYNGKLMVSTNATIYGGAANTKRHSIRMEVTTSEQALYVDGKLACESSITADGFANNTLPVYLFARNLAGAVNNPIPMRLWSFTWCDDTGALIRDFVPCKNASGTVGLYDMVNGVFYTDAAGGTFTAGPTYTEVARNIIGGYVGINNVARKIIKGYIGDENGLARLFISNGLKMAAGDIAYLPSSTVSITTGFKPKYIMLWCYRYYNSDPNVNYFTTIIYDNGWPQKALSSNANRSEAYQIELFEPSKYITIKSDGFSVKIDTNLFADEPKEFGYVAFG